MARILIAEDERDTRALAAFTLRFAGHEAFEACDGQEALKMAAEVQPDVILMDVVMPRMLGYEACRAIKADPQLKDIVVIFLTCRGQESDIQRGLEAGGDEYLLKPFAPDQLTGRIADILRKYRLGLYKE